MNPNGASSSRQYSSSSVCTIPTRRSKTRSCFLRFTKIGIPAPEIMGPFVGGCEVVFGALLIVGLLTRLAAIVLLIDISVAIVSTKIPVLLGHGFWGFSLMKLPRYGFWSMMHEARTDFSMWLGLLFLLSVGAGKWSFDAAITRGSVASQGTTAAR